MSSEYGAVNNNTQQDEETPLVTRDIEHHDESFKQKVRHFLRKHHLRIAGGWLLLIAVTAALTLGIHYALKDNKHAEIPENPKEGDEDLDMQCVSERSWFVALMLSIFLGPLGIDRFYLGYIFLGIIKLVTAGLGGIWWTVDVVLIALNVLNDHPNGCHLK